jgi:hypothetical protein
MMVATSVAARERRYKLWKHVVLVMKSGGGPVGIGLCSGANRSGDRDWRPRSNGVPGAQDRRPMAGKTS